MAKSLIIEQHLDTSFYFRGIGIEKYFVFHFHFGIVIAYSNYLIAKR
jgi:hypothetical protein